MNLILFSMSVIIISVFKILYRKLVIQFSQQTCEAGFSILIFHTWKVGPRDVNDWPN